MPSEFIIIDGYNLLISVGILRTSSVSLGPTELAKARQALIGFLARYLDVELRQRTTVVFDAKSAPPDIPSSEIVNDIHVIFATEHEEADDLIEHLVKRHSAPKQLTVVSSDNRIKTAATRRKARAIDSEIWFDQIREQYERSEPTSTSRDESIRNRRLSVEETSEWIEEFKIDDVDSVLPADPSEVESTRETQPQKVEDVESESDDSGSLFPPEYLEEIRKELGDEP